MTTFEYLGLRNTILLLSLAQLCTAQMPQVEFKFSYQIEKELSDGTLSPSRASYHYTYIGDHANALNTYGLPLRWGLDTLLIDQDYAQLHAVSADDYVAEQAANYQVTIINEAHNNTRHRVFVRSMLAKMYDKGYRHLGLECLLDPQKVPPEYRKDSLKYWGYPILSFAIGTYKREPQMGNLIREALSLGYALFPYERSDQKEERDLVQARNIADYVQNNPEGKFLILCGWDHAIEADVVKRRNDRFMAHHLRNFLDQDVLTIDQHIFSEKIAGQEYPGYRNLHAQSSSVFVDSRGASIPFFREFHHFDILVYHPPTYFLLGRPTWLYSAGKKKYHLNFDRIRSYPVIVTAIPSDNDIRATPVDIIEIKHRIDEKPLLLEDGQYVIELLYDDGTTDRLQIEVK